jgi:hypothetical protein
MSYTDEQIQFILGKKKEGKTYKEIAQTFKVEFEVNKTPNAIRHICRNYTDFDFSEDTMVKNIRSAHTARRSRSKVAKENRAILDYLDQRDELVDELKNIVKEVKAQKIRVPKKKKDTKKDNMKLEVMLSDLHYGKKTDTFNFEVAQQRMDKMANVVLDEIDRYSKTYNVEEVITFLGGDIIEGATIHGTESRIGSEASNAVQIAQATMSLFKDYVVPMVSSGCKLTFICIGGNHDRDGKDKTFQNPGEEHFTHTIYTLLEFMCKNNGFDVEFVIPKGAYHVHKIYDSFVCYEHGDFIKGNTRTSFESHLAKRSAQFGTIIDFLRIGHLHERMEFGRGKIIINPSLPGQDSYSEINGYNSEAAQTINYYVETDNRPTPFYHSFAVYLGD